MLVLHFEEKYFVARSAPFSTAYLPILALWTDVYESYFPCNALFFEVDSKALAAALLTSSSSFLVSKEPESVGFSYCINVLKWGHAPLNE